LEDPPGVCCLSWGFRVGPGVRKAYSAVTVLPTGTAPALRSMATQQASNVAGFPAGASEPQRVGMPATSITSFTPNGTPANGPCGSGSPCSLKPASVE